MYNKLTLDGGVRILYEQIPYVQSASIGIWIKNGSRHEDKAESGYSHFIEHMLFKGTHSRGAEQIAREMDRIGGQVNAFTTKECTCFYARVMKDHLPRAIDLLSDMIINSRFDEADVATERGVILEEIDMYEDSPDDLVSERLYTGIFKGNTLSKPVLGNAEVLEQATGKALADYMQKRYTGENIVVAISGCFEESDIELIKSDFSIFKRGSAVQINQAVYKNTFTVKKKPIEQNHLMMAFPGVSMTDPDRYAYFMLSSIFGGGMSSRLFQTVREQAGLCYSIYSFLSTHEETGIFGIYTALSSGTEQKAIELICNEMKKAVRDGVTEQELEIAREQIKASVYMSLESTLSRSNTLGKGEMFHGRVVTVDEVIAAYDAVTVRQINGIAEKLFDMSKLSFSAVGRVMKVADYKNAIQLCGK